LLTPDRFIRLLEESGQITVLGDRMLCEACLAAAGWHSHEHPLFVSVNLSIRQMMQTTLIDVVQRALAESGLPAACLKLEITESSSFYDVAGTVEVFAALKRLGVAVAFDDFGMGHSALRYLTSFPIDLLKIDRTFVATLGASEYDSRLARALIALATTLGLTMIAEGVETQEQVLALQQLGCELCQGYFFAPPLSMEEAVQFLGARE
jgi:EAL domain-containing protein (putative c-di-GMP-specific phosphodiesterase class I)